MTETLPQGMGRALFFVMSNSNCMCLICHVSIFLLKENNFERLLTTMHKRCGKKFPAESGVRKTTLKELKLIYWVKGNLLTLYACSHE